MADDRLVRRFFDQGMEILTRDGFAGLRMAPLCSDLGLTTGAFYHSFNNWKDFTDQLLNHWHVERTTRLVELVEENADPLTRLATLIEMTVALPHRAEAAIRVWSLSDPDAAIIQKSVDTERYDVVYSAFLEMTGDPTLARNYAHAGMYLLIGFEQAESIQDLESLGWSLDQLRQAAAAHQPG